MKTEFDLEGQRRAAARLTRRALIAFVVIEAVVIFGAIAITVRRKQVRTQTIHSPTIPPR